MCNCTCFIDKMDARKVFGMYATVSVAGFYHNIGMLTRHSKKVAVELC